MFGWFKRKPDTETRSSGTGYTSQVMQARADYITGVEGIAELTGTVQGAVSLWEGGLSLADVEGDLLSLGTFRIFRKILRTHHAKRHRNHPANAFVTL